MKLLRSMVFLKGYGWEQDDLFVVTLFMKAVMTRYHDAEWKLICFTLWTALIIGVSGVFSVANR